MSRRVLQGVVVSDKGDKTVVVRVERRVMHHPAYALFAFKRNSRACGHDGPRVVSLNPSGITDKVVSMPAVILCGQIVRTNLRKRTISPDL